MGYNNEGSSVIYDKGNSRTIMTTDSVVDSIIDEFINRSTLGKKKYKTDLDREDLSVDEWLQHAIEESMDHILYLRKLQQILRGKK